MWFGWCVLCAWADVKCISSGVIASVLCFLLVRAHISIHYVSCLVSDRWMCGICGERQMTFALVDTLKTLHHKTLHIKCGKCGVSRQTIIYLYFLSNCLTLMPVCASVMICYILALCCFGPVFINIHIIFISPSPPSFILHIHLCVCFYSCVVTEHSLSRRYYQCKYCPTHPQPHSLPTTLVSC